MKTITIVVPTYNEELNVLPVYNEITRVMEEELLNYKYNIMFIDNCSVDLTRTLIKKICAKDERVMAIMNAKNFGHVRSHYYALTQAQGDCAMLIHADLQNPPAEIPRFVKEWENGSKVVIGIKDSSGENRIMYFLRTCFYKLMKKISDVDQIEQFTDFELLDREFLDILQSVHDPLPYLRGIVAELGYKMTRVHYKQAARERGKTSTNFNMLYDIAMLGITSYSKSIIRLATKFGFILSIISILIATGTFIAKLVYWNKFPVGIAAMSIGIFLLGGLQLFFIGFLGEYVVNINVRSMNRPLVIEEERINFD